MTHLDIEQLSQHYRVSLEPYEAPEEREHRHHLERLKTYVQQGIHAVLAIFALGGVAVMLWYCLGILTGTIIVGGGAAPAVTAEAQKWAMTTLGSILAGIVGFLTGKALR